MTSKGFAIAIDGPVAAGKGTVAGALATEIHGFHLYTGAMYRCLSLYCLENNIAFTDTQKVISILPEVNIDFHDNKIWLNGKDVTETLKEREVAAGSSPVAAIAEVRAYMVNMQQKIGNRKIDEGTIVIAEGRDAATKIFPDAAVKIFLTANPEVRAQRRYEQLGGAANAEIAYEDILKDTKERDERDYNRAADPLMKEPEQHGYIVLNDSHLTEEQTIQEILDVLEERKLV